MADMKELAEKRRRAYDFIVQKAKKMNWSPPIDSDSTLAVALDIDVAELISLKEGRKNPTKGLIAKAKSLFGESLLENEVRAWLSEPFK